MLFWTVGWKVCYPINTFIIVSKRAPSLTVSYYVIVIQAE